MENKPSLVTCIKLHQKFDINYWDSNWNKQIIISQDIKSILEEITRRLNTITIVTDAYAINHDKDTHKEFNYDTQKYQTVYSDPHITAVLKFNKGVDFNILGDIIGIPEQHLEKAASGRYSFDNFLAYLVHAKDEDKYQYKPTEVITTIGIDYQKIHQNRFASWQQGRVSKNNIKNDKKIELLADAIIKGKITKNDLLLNEKFHSLYARHKIKINELFETRAEIKAAKSKNDLINHRYKKTILYIWGETGIGKTTIANHLIKKIIELSKINDESWDYRLTAGTNTVDGYLAEDILFLDDVKGYSLTSSDWLKLLDPHNFSPISARYANRDVTARVIIITNTKHPYEFFRQTKDRKEEDIAQFIRRIDSLVIVEKDDYSVKYRVEKSEKIASPNENNYLTYHFQEYDIKLGIDGIIKHLLEVVRKNNNWKNNIDTKESENKQ